MADFSQKSPYLLTPVCSRQNQFAIPLTKTNCSLSLLNLSICKTVNLYLTYEVLLFKNNLKKTRQECILCNACINFCMCHQENLHP